MNQLLEDVLKEKLYNPYGETYHEDDQPKKLNCRHDKGFFIPQPGMKRHCRQCGEPVGSAVSGKAYGGYLSQKRRPMESKEAIQSRMGDLSWLKPLGIEKSEDKPKQKFHLIPSEREKECKHTQGFVNRSPGAGPKQCNMCGTFEHDIEKCETGDRPHTPIVSEKQRGLFGAELARRREGKTGQMKGITSEELSGHLKEAGGKDLGKLHNDLQKGKLKPQVHFYSPPKHRGANARYHGDVYNEDAINRKSVDEKVFRQLPWHWEQNKPVDQIAADKALTRPSAQKEDEKVFRQSQSAQWLEQNKPTNMKKALLIHELVKASGVPAGWQGKSATCPHCNEAVRQVHPMQTMRAQMHKHLRKVHKFTHEQAYSATVGEMKL